MFSRRGRTVPEYCLKVRKPCPSVPHSISKGEQLSVEQEFRVMGEIREYFAHYPDFAGTVPEPLLHLDASNAILTEYHQGRLLKDVLLRAGSPLRFAPGSVGTGVAAARIGRWLRLLHEMPPKEWLFTVAGGDPRDLRMRTEVAFSSLGNDLKRRLPMTQLLEWSGQAMAGEAPAMSHGDFQPGNLIVFDGRFIVMDYATAGIRPPGEDLAWFLVFVMSQRERVVLGSSAGSRGFVAKVCRDFLSGYDADMPGASRTLRPYLASLVVTRLADLQNRIERAMPPARPVLRKRLVAWADSELRWFLGEFE
jgi:aminoglycoside phosphotransferase (APT) family kinase protein